MGWWKTIGMLALVAAYTAVSRQPALAQAPPTRLFGTITIAGQPAAVGTVVEAFVRGLLCGEGVVRRVSEQLPVGYVVDVAADAQRPGCGRDGDAVSLRVGGEPAAESATFQTGLFVRLDLTVARLGATPTPGPTPPPFGAPLTPAPTSAGSGSIAPTATPAGVSTVIVPISGGRVTPPGSSDTDTGPAGSGERRDQDNGSVAMIVFWGGLMVAAALAVGAGGYLLYRRR